MLPTQELINHLAGRIERAFTLRSREWYAGCSTPRVWEAAALTLLEAAHGQDEVPLDPELYVASQPLKSRFPDPWKCLASPRAARRYRRRVRRIIRQLHSELKREIHRAEALVQMGHGLDKFIEPRSSRFSPLGLYITAHRMGCVDMVNALRAEVIEQHNCCPLYRTACRSLLPARAYPLQDRHRGFEIETTYPVPLSLLLQN